MLRGSRLLMIHVCVCGYCQHEYIAVYVLLAGYINNIYIYILIKAVLHKHWYLFSYFGSKRA